MRDVINIEKEPYNFAVSIESVSLFDFELNLFSPNVPFMDKPGSWFLRKWGIGRKWVWNIQYILFVFLTLFKLDKFLFLSR